jgi:hypothetical protein
MAREGRPGGYDVASHYYQPLGLLPFRDIALARSDHDAARAAWEAALALYARIAEPYSVG